MKIRPVGAQSFHADGRTAKGQTDIPAFRNFLGMKLKLVIIGITNRAELFVFASKQRTKAQIIDSPSISWIRKKKQNI